MFKKKKIILSSFDKFMFNAQMVFAICCSFLVDGFLNA